MAEITIAQVCDAIEATLATSSQVNRSQSYDEIGEGIHDTPLLMVYPQSGHQSADSLTDRFTFGAGVRQTELIIYADYYARQRSNIGEDMSLLVDGLDDLFRILEGQDKKPYFDLEGIQAFSWSFDRVQFEYSGVAYVGCRFTITVRIF